ncbi:MAG: hypothetical protein K2F90_00275 [Clostridiales bacterium]|nr:hypothetical protein [Clostridiales bacterium]
MQYEKHKEKAHTPAVDVSIWNHVNFCSKKWTSLQKILTENVKTTFCCRGAT